MTKEFPPAREIRDLQDHDYLVAIRRASRHLMDNMELEHYPRNLLRRGLSRGYVSDVEGRRCGILDDAMSYSAALGAYIMSNQADIIENVEGWRKDQLETEAGPLGKLGELRVEGCS